jgi:hypothetical protein
MHAQSGAVVVAPPQPLGGFGKQVLREVPGAVIRAQFRLQHMLMADAFGEARGGRLDIDASIWWKSTPLMPPHTRRNWNGVAFQSCATVKMPVRLSLCSMRAPMP